MANCRARIKVGEEVFECSFTEHGFGEDGIREHVTFGGTAFYGEKSDDKTIAALRLAEAHESMAAFEMHWFENRTPIRDA